MVSDARLRHRCLAPGAEACLICRNLPRLASVAGWTFAGLAFVQAFSYPIHDPVLTDRAFITDPKTMLKGFFLPGLIGGGFIFLIGCLIPKRVKAAFGPEPRTV